jgi:hypothetical protein
LDHFDDANVPNCANGGNDVAEHSESDDDSAEGDGNMDRSLEPDYDDDATPAL